MNEVSVFLNHKDNRAKSERVASILMEETVIFDNQVI